MHGCGDCAGCPICAGEFCTEPHGARRDSDCLAGTGGGVLGRYAATRPDTDAWIGRTLKTVLAASVPSLIWAVFWFIR